MAQICIRCEADTVCMSGKEKAMKAKILGIGQRHSGTSKKSGKPYDCTSIYCACTASDVVGEKVQEITFNHLVGMDFPDIHVGDIIYISHDNRGYLEEIFVVEKDGKVPQAGNVKINRTGE